MIPRVLHDPERARLCALADAIGTPAIPLTADDRRPDPPSPELRRTGKGRPTGVDDRRVEEAAVAAVDTLLARVARVTATLRAGDAAAPLDPAATRLLLADLALVAGLLRSLNGATADRLASAVADLQQARDEADRAGQADRAGEAGRAGGGH